MYDDAFLARLRAREPRAQRTFYENERARVERACALLIGGVGRAEDIAADVLDDFLFIHVDGIQRGHSLRLHLQGWVRTHCRRARRLDQRRGDDDPERAAGPEERLVELPRRLDRLHGAIEALTPQERRAVRLSFYHDLKNAEIARMLGLSRARVTQLMQSALARLRHTLPADPEA